MKNHILLTPLIIALLFLSPFAHAKNKIGKFDVDSYKTILADNHANPFLMVLWSVDCPPCIEELPTLSQFQQSHPTANIVMISTDGKNNIVEIQYLIDKYQLSNVQHWVFNETSIQAARYAIDPLWYGELPRTYFHNSYHKRKAKSGRLDEETLMAWYKTINNKTAGL